MGNKEEWEEIEKSVKESEQKKLEAHKGIDYTNMLNKINKKPKEKTLKKLTIKILKPIIIIFCIIAGIIGFIVARDYGYNMRHSHNIDVKKDIENFADIEINEISSNLDEKGYTGEYYFELKKVPQIKFKAIKNYGAQINDLNDNIAKYIFEHWNSPQKSKFKVEENKDENDLLEYKTYIEINTYEEAVEGTKTIIEFLKYAEKWNKENGKVVNFWQQKEGQFVMPLYNVYLVKDNDRISPHSGLFETEEEIMKNLEKKYNEVVYRKK